MLRILLVDDEQIERDGIRRLLDKQGFQLEVLEAENGEEALEILGSTTIDILLTDIKMPFMDGLELARRVRGQDIAVKIIIFSAYGEFEYAQKAISYNIYAYLLKPVEVEEFVRVMTRVTNQCLEERQQQEQEQQLRRGYEKGVEYEKGKMLLDLLAGVGTGGEYWPAWAGEPLGERRVQMVLADFGERFFDQHGQRFLETLKGLIEPAAFEYVNLNESQSLLFLLLPPVEKEDTDLPDKLKAGIDGSFGKRVTWVVGQPVSRIDLLHEEYIRMEAMLENQFFFRDSIVFYTGLSHGRTGGSGTEDLSELLEPVYWHLEAKDYYGFRKGVEVFFQMLADAHHQSAIYIKYLCIELMRKLIEATGRETQVDFRAFVEEIFSSRNLSDIKVHVEKVLELLPAPQEPGGPEYTKKVIKDILQLIDDHYMEDISLKWIADKVFLTQTYVSHLFSRETGQTFVKYLTMVRMQKAAEELRRTNDTITHISEKVGYTNDSYFGKIFKNYFGLSPAKYREMNG